MLINRNRVDSGVSMTIVMVLAITALAGATDAERGRGPQYSMPFATVSPGAANFANGSFAILGQPLVGEMANGQFTMQVGAVPVLLLTVPPPLPGDADGDGDVDLDDHAVFFDCMAGPDTAPSPTPPTTPQDCLNVFDFDDEADVDLFDFAAFQAILGG
ncbi:MAG: hypothetical protein GY778_19810 [bacterium]|nr:hypothetical protein [bacterium]